MRKRNSTIHDAQRDSSIDMVTRACQLRSATINEDNRSVEAVIATEAPVQVFDFRSWNYIDEVLRMDGLQMPANGQVPLLDSHSRSGVGAVLGSTRDIRIEGPQLVGRNYFSKRATDAWDDVRDGHITDNSVGYRVTEFTDIKPGETAIVNGRTYTANKLPLRVTTGWRLRENSLTVEGADQLAKMREAYIANRNGGSPPAKNKEIAMFDLWLKARGVDVSTLDDAKREAYRKEYEAEIRKEIKQPEKPANDPPKEPVREASTPTAEEVSERAVKAERERVNSIRKEGRDASVSDEVIEREISEGHDINEARKAFLADIRGRRAPSVGVVNTDQANSREVIEAAMSLTAMLPERSIASTIPESRREEVMNRAMEPRMRGFGLHSLMDATIRATGRSYEGERKSNAFVREALEADAMIRSSAFSTASLSGVLSNVAGKGLIASYTAVEVTWPMIAAVRNHNDFKSHARYRMDTTGAYKKVAADGELKHLALSDATYTNQVYTYGAIVALTRQAMVNDDLGAFTQMFSIMGRLSALRKEEAVYVLLLSNPSSFFASGNGNYISGATTALSIASLGTAEKAFRDFVSDGKPVMVSPKTLLVGTTLAADAQNIFDERVIIASSLGSTSSKVVEPAKNKMYNKYAPVVSPYIDNTSVLDQDGGAITGQSSTAWWLFADPAVRAAVAIAFLNGQQTPTVESAATDFNTLGMQFRAYDDFGVGMEETTGAVMSKGAA